MTVTAVGFADAIVTNEGRAEMAEGTKEGRKELADGPAVGLLLGKSVGTAVVRTRIVGLQLGSFVGAKVGMPDVGLTDGIAVGLGLGTIVGEAANRLRLLFNPLFRELSIVARQV